MTYDELTSALLKTEVERDEARAECDQLRTVIERHGQELAGAVLDCDEARAIARRLAVVVRLALGDEVAGEMAHAYGDDVTQDCRDILAAFDALAWSRDEQS